MKIVKNSINHILSFILMITITCLLVFIIFEYNLSLRSINKNMYNMNYYNKVYDNVIEKINDFIILEDVQELYKNYLTIDLIKEDITKITKNIYISSEYKISRYNEFYKLIYDYCEDEEVSKKYATEINDIYRENLFPAMPFKLIKKLYLKPIFQALIIFYLVIISLFIGYFLYLFNKSYKYIITSILGTSILIILPNIFIRIFKIFNGFLYTNEYFTKVILNIVYNTFNTLNIIGFFIILFIFMWWITKRFRKEKNS